MENEDRTQTETLQYLDELKKKREINEKLYQIAMNYRLEQELQKQSKEENLYQRIETLEYQFSQLLNPPPVVSEENIKKSSKTFSMLYKLCQLELS